MIFYHFFDFLQNKSILYRGGCKSAQNIKFHIRNSRGKGAISVRTIEVSVYRRKHILLRIQLIFKTIALNILIQLYSSSIRMSPLANSVRIGSPIWYNTDLHVT